jgi:phosphoribosylaminoimidazolecarboxamide formyltransferase/IMP cyclohydrolase
MRKIERAIISVTDKTGVVDFAKKLSDFGVEILSTGGTAKALREGGVPVTDISDYTGFPEMLDGRVKTLHPKVHGGLLGLRDNLEHVRTMAEHGIENIDMLVVNLYQFEKTVAKEGVTLEEAIENIDIGGPAMLRSSAKNFKDVTVVVDPSDYEKVLKEMQENGGATLPETRFGLAKKVFKLTHQYDGAISRYLEEVNL